MAVMASFAVPHPPIILPEVGRGEEKKIQQTINAYREISRRIAALRPETIVLASPHAVMYGDYFHISPGRWADGDLGGFGASGVSESVGYDTEFVSSLADAAQQDGLSAGTLGEREKKLDHGTLIPLRFLNEAYRDFRLVRIGLSGLPAIEHYRLGKCIALTARRLNRKVVFIASGDLSHKLKPDGPYGFAPQGPEFDRQATSAMAQGEFLKLLEFDPAFCEAAAECGLRSLQIMAGTLDGMAVSSELLSYEGPFGVGYAVAAFSVAGADETRRFGERYEVLEKERLETLKAEEDPYVRLARHSLETFVKTGRRAPLPQVQDQDLLRRRAGVFVSLKKDGELRGCIGTTGPVTECVATEIMRNAVSAGTQDPRFRPVKPDELAKLVYSVDVLGEMQSVESPKQLDAKRYGVVVSNGRRQGLLLPNLEGVNTAEEQIAIAKRKAGIGEDEPCRLERFEVKRHK